MLFLSSMLPQCMALSITYVSYVSCVNKNIYATSKQGRRLRFGMLTVLTNLRSTKVLNHASYIMHHASCIFGPNIEPNIGHDIEHNIEHNIEPNIEPKY